MLNNQKEGKTMTKETIKELHTSTTTDVMAKDLRSTPSVTVLRLDVEEDYTDQDPITPEEEKDLRISMSEFRKGKAIHIPGYYTEEEFFRVLRE